MSKKVKQLGIQYIKHLSLLVLYCKNKKTLITLLTDRQTDKTIYKVNAHKSQKSSPKIFELYIFNRSQENIIGPN